MAYLVGIDLETTSLDPTTGNIIEVAAIRFDSRLQEQARYEALCHAPYVSAETTAITGISTSMLQDQKPFAEHIPALRRFIGEDTLLAHNAAFDIAWLTHHGLKLKNPVWDTFYLAALVWPEAESYNLGTLAREKGIVIQGEHRASEDVFLTWRLFQTMQKYFQLPRSLKETFTAVLNSAGESHYLPLFSFKDDRPRKSSIKKKITTPSLGKMSVQKILGEQGVFTQKIAGFIPRLEQINLADYMLECYQGKQSAVVEAGPGVGKTFAYLTAGLLAGGRLLISTYSKILQDQIVGKDIPRVIEALGLRHSYTTLKGRGNYVCGTRLLARLRATSIEREEAGILLKIALWLARGGSGDLEQLNLSHLNRGLLRHLHADHAICRQKCQPGTCPYQAARAAAATADIVVVNHALLMQWALGEDSSRELGFNQLIIDEAHQLEEAARKASQIEFSLERLQDIASAAGPILDSGQLHKEKNALSQEFSHLLAITADMVSQYANGRELRLSGSLRRGKIFQKFQAQGLLLLQRLRFITGLIRSQKASQKKNNNKLYKETIRNFERFSIEWEQFLQGRNKNRVQYIEKNMQKIRLIDTSLEVASFTQPFLTTIAPTFLLSATLTVEGKMDYVEKILGISSWRENNFSSVFDYPNQMTILIADDGPYPNQDSHDLFSAQLIAEIGQKTNGRILTLFTSKKSLQLVHQSTSKYLSKENIRLLSQGISGGRHNISRRFQADHSSILFGLSSFWEGFDSPGETLSVLVIPKLPFPAISDPVIEALSEARPGTAFQEVLLPRMILRLKQGVGRLIRTMSDRGVVVILDRRLTEKEYGRRVLHSLPNCPVEVLGSRDLPQKVAEFFGQETIARWQEKP